MHIPDGFLSSEVIIGTSTISGAVFLYSLYKLKKQLDEKMIPIISVLSAFIFAAQMVNFPIYGGTSGHLVGAGLASILLGPLNAFFIISIVLIIQCFFFADGGITALGANILNMAIVGVVSSYILFKVLSLFFKNKLINAGIASAVAVVLSAITVALELGISKTVPFLPVLVALTGWHVLIGIGEGVITFFTLGVIYKRLPELNLFKIEGK